MWDFFQEIQLNDLRKRQSDVESAVWEKSQPWLTSISRVSTYIPVEIEKSEEVVPAHQSAINIEGRRRKTCC